MHLKLPNKAKQCCRQIERRERGFWSRKHCWENFIMKA